jgi:hypothetical protein
MNPVSSFDVYLFLLQILGDAESSVEPVVTMGAEDFSYYLLQRPGEMNT